MGLFSKRKELNYIKVIQETASESKLVDNVTMSGQDVMINITGSEAFILVSPYRDKKGNLDHIILTAIYQDLEKISKEMNVSKSEAYMKLGSKLQALVPQPKILSNSITLTSKVVTHTSDEQSFKSYVLSLLAEASFIGYTIEKMKRGEN